MRLTFVDEVVQTDYGQMDITWSSESFGFDGVFDRFFDDQINGLVGAADPNGVYFHFARRSGGSRLCIELVDTAPEDQPAYQDVVEVSVQIPEGADVHWFSWAGETQGVLDLPGASYRMRVSAKDRDAGRIGEFADDVVDSYLIQFWPESPRPDEIVRIGSQDAEYWHREIGSRRAV